MLRCKGSKNVQDTQSLTRNPLKSGAGREPYFSGQEPQNITHESYFTTPGYLFPIVNPFYPRRDRGQYLVWNGLQLARKFADGEFFAEDDDGVSFARVDIGDVDHAGIHADITDDRTTVAVNHDFAATIAEMTVQA